MQVFTESPLQEYGVSNNQPCFLFHQKGTQNEVIYPPIVNEISVQGDFTVYDLIGLLVVQNSTGIVGGREYTIVKCNGICLVSPTTKITFTSKNSIFTKPNPPIHNERTVDTSSNPETPTGIMELDKAINEYKSPLLTEIELNYRIKIIKQIYIEYQLYQRNKQPKTIVIHGPPMTGKTFLLKTILSMFPHIYINKLIDTEKLYANTLHEPIAYGVDVDLEMQGFVITTNTELNPTFKISMNKTFQDCITEQQIQLQLKSPVQSTKLLFKDLYGIDKYIQEIKELVFKDIPKGMLIYGKPGTGKTTLGIAVGNELERFGLKPLFISSTDLISKITGKTEENITNLFKLPNICLVIDNFENIGKRNNRILHCFLNEMDGIKTSNVFVIGIASDIKLIDPALIRRKRIDVYIELNDVDINHLVTGLTRNMPFGFDVGQVADGCQGKSAGDVVGLLHSVSMDCIRKGKDVIEWSDFEPYI
ncbi:AAA ATPase cdc48 [Terramyces sp. JEL0728]|nr:AAA ATPase cdc48 [Terramyces sp. JEL0728]